MLLRYCSKSSACVPELDAFDKKKGIKLLVECVDVSKHTKPTWISKNKVIKDIDWAKQIINKVINIIFVDLVEPNKTL